MLKLLNKNNDFSLLRTLGGQCDKIIVININEGA